MLARIRRNGLRLLSTGTLVIGLLYVLVAWVSASQIEPYQQGWVVAYPIVLFVQQTVGWLALAALGLVVYIGSMFVSQASSNVPRTTTPIPSLALAWVLIIGSAATCIVFPQVRAVGLLSLFIGVGLLLLLNFGKSFWLGAALSATVVGCALANSVALLTGFESLEGEAAASIHDRSYVLATLTLSGFDCVDKYLVVLACDSANFMCHRQWQSDSYRTCSGSDNVDKSFPSEVTLISDEVSDSLYVQLDGERIEVPVGG